MNAGAFLDLWTQVTQFENFQKITVPRENGYRMNDWIRNRIVFMLFYSIYKKDTKFERIET